MTELHASALRYVKRGWPVFPLSPGGKKPLPRSNGFKDATTDSTVIDDWWRDHPEANIGLATGRAMGVWVLDVDGPQGAASLTALEAELGALPETLDQQTGGGGRQLFFLWPKDRETRNKQNLRPGIDVRGEGGYVVAPPSIHPSGNPYQWVSGERGRIAEIPQAWLDFVCPPKAKPLAPWERVATPRRRVPAPERTPVIVRAERYLEECDAAVEGAGGHNALLWAARALVVGFELPDATALGLLWSHFNPRCSPPWREDVERDRRDFERKVSEARSTPSEKRSGWLLDELGLRDATEKLAQIAHGQRSASLLLASVVNKALTDPEPFQLEDPEPAPVVVPDRTPFPIDHFPAPIRSYVKQVSQSHGVDISWAALPVLVTAAGAMGNAWRMTLKPGFVVPPTLWGAIIGGSGTNKSGPLDEIVKPMNLPVPMDRIVRPLLNPQGDPVAGNVTMEALLELLGETPRGIFQFRDELAGWALSFDNYRQGGDEATWLELWNAKRYKIARKTNSERTNIPAASVCVLGGIQPGVMAKCFEPSKFDSGLVQRILIACPPRTPNFWNDDVVEEVSIELWTEVVMWLRTRPFDSLDPNTGAYKANQLKLDEEARAAFVTFHDSIALDIYNTNDDHCRSFMAKSQTMAGRLALVHHGLKLASRGEDEIRLDVEIDSMTAGAAWARWFLNEQIRVYGFATKAAREKDARELVVKIRAKYGEAATVRQICRLNSKKYKDTKVGAAAAGQLVELGHGEWATPAKKKINLFKGDH